MPAALRRRQSMEDASCVISDWQSSIVHADMADWVTVAAYLLAALLSARAAGHAGLRRQARDSMFWRITAVCSPSAPMAQI